MDAKRQFLQQCITSRYSCTPGMFILKYGDEWRRKAVPAQEHIVPDFGIAKRLGMPSSLHFFVIVTKISGRHKGICVYTSLFEGLTKLPTSDKIVRSPSEVDLSRC